MNKYFILLLLLIASFSFSQNRFSKDVTLRKIYGFEYDRQSDSLKPYLDHSNKSYLFAAIQAVSSIQDTAVAQKILEMLNTEKIDSVKLALIYSLSQLDCKVAFKGLNLYYPSHKKEKVGWACIEAIGKISKVDVTDFFNQSFSSQKKHDTPFLSYWLKGLYLAKRRKNIDMNKDNEQLVHHLKYIIDNQIGRADEVNYYYSKIMNLTALAAPEIVKTNIESLKKIDAQLSSLKTPYQQIDALGKYKLSAQACREFIFSNYHPLIKRHALDIYLKEYTWNNLPDKAFFESIFDQMDVALISGLSEYIAEQNELKKPVGMDVHVLQNLQRQLFLPRDFETWIDLEKAILSFEGKKYQYKSCFEKGIENPIDWNYIVKIDQQQKVKITTNKGVMVLLLKVNESPASVANFLKLVGIGYYNGKYFHRMVPNFVVQGGCHRGDGWGSLDWNQRSELSSNLRYKKGSVGLASVGKDSEGAQFFISHNLAPHLDGRYTIFAEVVEGLNVIENLMVGDQMLAIERID